jgi:hypothetical protein
MLHWLLTVFLQFALFPISLAGQAVIGRKLAVGWLMGLGTQVLWALYALYGVHQPGLLLGTCSYAVLYALNWFTWTKPLATARAVAAVRSLLLIPPPRGFRPNPRKGRRMLEAWVVAG